MAMTVEQRKARRSELRFDKQDKLYRSAKAAMIRIWTEGADNLETHEMILENRSKLVESETWKRMAAYDRARVWGISDAMYDLMWKRLVWTHVLDGKRVLSTDVPSERIHDIDTDDSAHCYVTPEGMLVPWRAAERLRDVQAGR